MVGYADIAALSGLPEDVILDQKALARSTGAGADKSGDDSKEPELLVSLDNAGRGCVIVGCMSTVRCGDRCRQRWVLAASRRHQRQRRDLGTYRRPSRVVTTSLLWKGVVVTLVIVEGEVVVAAAVVVERGVILLAKGSATLIIHIPIIHVTSTIFLVFRWLGIPTPHIYCSTLLQLILS